ncbi:MAG: hypothetical protein Q7T78_10500 [Rhodoferax sp.]|nr:hypothetical protein [Rhodoferax sp.]
MSIALFAVPGVLAPLQGLWRWLLPATAQGGPAHASADKRGREIAINSIANNTRHAGAELHNASKTSARRPLRVVRVLEAGQAPANVGRMVISGRMADVCAELDRLAAREAALH